MDVLDLIPPGGYVDLSVPGLRPFSAVDGAHQDLCELCAASPRAATGEFAHVCAGCAPKTTLVDGSDLKPTQLSNELDEHDEARELAERWAGSPGPQTTIEER